MKKIAGLLILFLLLTPIYAQSEEAVEQKAESFEVYFEQNRSNLDLNFGQNTKVIDELSACIDKLQADTLVTIVKVEIDSSTSPEGGRTLNDKLSISRSDALSEYLSTSTTLPDSLLVKNNSGIDWDGLKALVEASNMQYRSEVLHIINTVPEETWRRVKPDDRWLSLVDSRNKHLMDLKYGNPYRYMLEHIYPKLRRGSIVTVYFKRELPPVIEQKPVKEPEPEPTPTPEPIAEAASESTTEFKPLLAVKTNLLYDAVTALNLELEVPIGQRWSVAAEWVFPWWTSGDKESSKRNCFQLLNGNIEGKYWFGDRTERLVMTGWHVGLYAGGGLYDLERNKVGYQGEFFIAAGLSGGYAHTIFENKIPNGNLRMEYSVAVGYLQTNYDKYAEHWGIDNSWHTVREQSGTYSWFGPTRAKVSLVWMFNRKVNKEK